MPRITKRLVDSLKPKDTRYVAWDDDIRGFGVRVSPISGKHPDGIKTYLLKYRAGGGRKAKQRWFRIGDHGTITPSEAREIAKVRSAQIAAGKDPQGERIGQRDAPTVDALCERYLREHAEPHKRPSSVAEDRRLIDVRIKPALGREKVNDISITDVERVHQSLRTRPYEANRTLALLSKMFGLAEKWKLRDRGTNPCRHVTRFKEEARARYLSPAELGNLGEVLTSLAAENEISDTAAAAIRLLLFTGCRLGEILSLEWDQVDFEAARLRLPQSKTGKKEVYLPAPALEVLSNIRRISGNPYVITGVRPGEPLKNLYRPWHAARDLAGLTDVRLHDLRHTFASFGAGAGLSLPVIGKLLGHTQAQTTQRYAHLADDPLRQAVEAVGSTIAAALSGKAGKVVDLQKKRP